MLGKHNGYTALNTADTPSLLALWQAVQQLDNWYVEYAASLAVQTAQERLEFNYVDGKAACMSRAEYFCMWLTTAATPHPSRNKS